MEEQDKIEMVDATNLEFRKSTALEDQINELTEVATNLRDSTNRYRRGLERLNHFEPTHDRAKTGEIKSSEDMPAIAKINEIIHSLSVIANDLIECNENLDRTV
jgi:hypothetical protein